MDAAERVRQRINEWLNAQGHGSQKRLADAVASRYGRSKAPTWMTGIIKGPAKKGQDLRLADLDDVADALGVPPGDLVRRHDRHYMEVTMTEARLLQHYRSLPETIRSGWIAWMDYLFRFQQSALADHRQERDTRTRRARKQEAPVAREHAQVERK